jgi:hypothetical protein
MKIWIRRDKNNQLWLYTKKPIYDENIKTYFPDLGSNMSRLNSHLFPDIAPKSLPVEFNIEQVIPQKSETTERFS